MGSELRCQSQGAVPGSESRLIFGYTYFRGVYFRRLFKCPTDMTDWNRIQEMCAASNETLAAFLFGRG